MRAVRAHVGEQVRVLVLGVPSYSTSHLPVIVLHAACRSQLDRLVVPEALNAGSRHGVLRLHVHRSLVARIALVMLGHHR